MLRPLYPIDETGQNNPSGRQELHTAPPPWKGGALLLSYTRVTSADLAFSGPALGVLHTLAEEWGWLSNRYRAPRRVPGRDPATPTATVNWPC